MTKMTNLNMTMNLPVKKLTIILVMMMEMTKMTNLKMTMNLPVKKLTIILVVMQVFHLLKDFMWSKITIPNVIMLVLILWG
jgi:hypothetical protein